MKRFTMLCALAISVAIGTPGVAAAAQQSQALAAASPLRLVISLVGLGVAMVLLSEVVLLRRVALGGAIAERISYVVLAIVCLGASALSQWTRNFVTGVTLEQLQITSEMLVIVAMGLFAAYFASVRRTLEGFMKAMTGGEMLAAEKTELVTADGDSTDAASMPSAASEEPRA